MEEITLSGEQRATVRAAVESMSPVLLFMYEDHQETCLCTQYADVLLRISGYSRADLVWLAVEGDFDV